jgi:hypothetical protein
MRQRKLLTMPKTTSRKNNIHLRGIKMESDKLNFRKIWEDWLIGKEPSQQEKDCAVAAFKEANEHADVCYLAQLFSAIEQPTQENLAFLKRFIGPNVDDSNMYAALRSLELWNLVGVDAEFLFGLARPESIEKHELSMIWAIDILGRKAKGETDSRRFLIDLLRLGENYQFEIPEQQNLYIGWVRSAQGR